MENVCSPMSFSSDPNSRPLMSHCVIERTRDMVDAENRLRATALVITAPCAHPCQVKEALLAEFAEMPRSAVDVSILTARCFLVRFTDRGWRDLVALTTVFHDDQATPFRVQEWTPDIDAELLQPLYRVRVLLERVPPQAWSLETAKKLLPMCRIVSIERETYMRRGMSFYVLHAEVDHPDIIPRVGRLDIAHDWALDEELDDIDLPDWFVEVEQLQNQVYGSGLLRRRHVLIHVDGVLEILPAPPSLHTGRRPARRPLVSEPVPSTTPWVAGYIDGTGLDSSMLGLQQVYRLHYVSGSDGVVVPCMVPVTDGYAWLLSDSMAPRHG